MCKSKRLKNSTTPSFRFRTSLGLLALFAALPAAHAAGDLTGMGLEQLMNLKVVSASKYEQSQSEVAAAVTVISRDEIRSFGWRTIEEALASLPGIHTTYDRQYSYLGTRGFGLPGDFNTRVLVTVNGNRINDPVYDGGPMGRQLPIDLDLVERIEFVPGPGGAVYGQNAMFAVINVITRNGADVNGVELAVSGQSPQRLREGRVSVGRRLENGVQVLLSASGMQARGEDRFYDFGAAGVSGIAAGLDADRDREFFGRIGRGPWSFDLIYGKQRKSDPTGAYFSDPLVPGQYQQDRYLIAHWQYHQSLRGDTLHLLARLFAGQENYDGRLYYGTPYTFPAEGRWHGGELRLLSTASASHKLMVGAEFQQNARLRQEVHDLAEPVNDILIAGSGSRVGIYLQDEWSINDTLATTVGLRVDHSTAGGTKTSPRAALIWRATPDTVLKALAGRAHRAPNAYERDYDDGFAVVANPSLRSESIDTLELVADRRVGPELALRASIYKWNMVNLITLGIDPVSGIPQYQSGEEVDARGLELSMIKTWRSGARLRASVSLQDVAYVNGGKLLNSPKLLGKLNASAPLPWAGLRAGYEWRYFSRRLTVDGSETGAYAVSNLYLRTGALAKGLEVSLGIRNLFGKRYDHPAADSNWQNALDQNGRSVRLEARYQF